MAMSETDVAHLDVGAAPADFYWLQAVWSALTLGQSTYAASPYLGPVSIFLPQEEIERQHGMWSRYTPAGKVHRVSKSRPLGIMRSNDFRSVFARENDSAVAQLGVDE